MLLTSITAKCDWCGKKERLSTSNTLQAERTLATKGWIIEHFEACTWHYCSKRCQNQDSEANEE